MLQDKTAAIIMLCKGNITEESKILIEKWELDTDGIIRLYLSNYAGVPVSYIEVDQAKFALRDAVIDVIQNMKNSSLLLHRIFDFLDRGYDELHALATALRLIQVKADKDTYINGFSEELTKPVHLCSGEV